MAVTTSKIAVALGLTAPEFGSITENQWTMWVEDAGMLIETRRVALGVAVIDQMKLDYVVREAVVAHIKKPDDATQVTIAVDDASTSKSYRSGKGRVTIIDEWWTLLGLTDPKGAFSVDQAGSSYGLHLDWCSIRFGAGFCSCGVDIAGVPLFGVTP